MARPGARMLRRGGDGRGREWRRGEGKGGGSRSTFVGGGLVELSAGGTFPDNFSKLVLEEELFSPEGWLEVVEPDRLVVVRSEEGLLGPGRVAGLKELEHHDLLAVDVSRADVVHLPGVAAHGGPAHGPCQAGLLREGLGENVVGLDERHVEVLPGTSVPADEEVVGHAAEANLLLPHAGPGGGVVVHVAHEGGLGANLGAGVADATDGLAHDGGPELGWVGEVCHDRHVLAGLDSVLKQTEHRISVGIRDEAVRPVRERLGADADGLNVVVLGRVENGADVPSHLLGGHHHGIAAGEQQV
mmetsp:Transcript_5093/g.21773  ORF Transcript_5093/g.21773 Transcript_5093/m.21773 type:complete len:301 (+) Transcript_5093:519-1421(+)